MRIALALVLLGSLAHADTKTIKAAKLAITVPDGWKTTVSKDIGLTVVSPDNDVAVLAWSVDPAELAADAAQKKIDGELYSMVFAPKWDKPETRTGHDLKITLLSATGKTKASPATHTKAGEPPPSSSVIDVAIRAAVVGPTANKKGLLVATVVRVDKLEAHKAEIDKILSSVQAAK